MDLSWTVLGMARSVLGLDHPEALLREESEAVGVDRSSEATSEINPGWPYGATERPKLVGRPSSRSEAVARRHLIASASSPSKILASTERGDPEAPVTDFA